MSRAFNFGLSVEVKHTTGEIAACYFTIRLGKVAKTKEYADGKVFADYDSNGDLLGIEVLAPCKQTVLDSIAESAKAKKFIRHSAPASMLVAS